MSDLDENEQIAQRREKLNQMRQAGQAYPNDFKRDALAGDLFDAYSELDKEALEEKGIEVSIAGRMMTRRVMGKASFAHLQDMTGQIQCFVQKQALAEGVYDAFKKWDIGDILAGKGTVFKTKTGELSVKLSELRLITKALRPLPEKFHGLADQETRYRQRYVDLIMNESSREVFRVRSATVQYIRQFLIDKRFTEVETPMMQVIPGGATARPFKTHHNALDMELFLRIAPELYLKRLVVGGMEKVFEINRNFRNEGLSTRHNPEFTMIEFYQAYADYHDLMDLTEEMLRGLTETVLGSSTVEYQGDTYEFSKPFTRMTIKESILKLNDDISADELENIESARAICQRLKIKFKDTYGLGKLQIEIFEKTVEAKLKQPTFITEYPVEVSPLARRSEINDFVTDRFEFFVGGRELANGFSELNDPEDQAQRFQQQVNEKDAGDDEAMHYDADYIRALEYGMPPTAGEGIGIDRLVMLLTDSPSIRDVLLFPHMRPE
ncbi:MAG: lysine--tRNA ligase [Gammaproteobacteria bacterium]|nr:lysine--tRNA ligase [Gammaproteobacteria bacterium]